MVFQNKARPDLSPPLAISNLGDLNQMNSGVYCVPALLGDDGLEVAEDQTQHRPNLSGTAQSYLERLGADALDLVHHVITVLHEPTYNRLNADALRAEGPRIPLLGWPDGEAEDAAAEHAASAARGRALAQLLDADTPVRGVTEGTLRPKIAALAVPTTLDGHHMTGDDFALTAGWGHYGSGDAVMPGQGRLVERPYTPEERAAMGHGLPVLGETTFDIYLNARAFWRNIPAQVWTYKLGGYQVLKKWLSYREREILGRMLTPEDVQYLAISEFPKGRKYLISLSFRGKASVRPAQVGGFDVNIVIHGSTAVRGRADLVAYRWALWKLTAPWTHRTRPPHLGKRCAFPTSFHRAFPIKSFTKNPERPQNSVGKPG